MPARDDRGLGPSTRAVSAGLPQAAQGEPFLPGPVFAAPYHLSGPADAARYDYGRYENPSWDRFEAALGELEGGEALAFPSGMAAVTAVLVAGLGPGDVLVAPSDAYPAVRAIASDHLEPRGVEVRFAPTDEAAVRAALRGATLVWVESPSNPHLDVVDLSALAADVHAVGAILVVDNTLATPLGQRPLELGADISMASATKYVTGHSDLMMGYVATRDPARVAALREWRRMTGSIPGPFEAWLAHRSLATIAVRFERQLANAQAIAAFLRERQDVDDVRWPGLGAVVCFDLGSEPRAQAFLDSCELVTEATSFGGVHTSAERRARWGTDAVGEGFVRLSAGIEDAPDLLADLGRALTAAAG